MSWAPDHAWVIGRRDREDRRARFAAGTAALGFDVQSFNAVEPLAPRPGWTASRQALGCALSHRAVLARSTGTVLVFEDDAVLAADFTARLQQLVAELPHDWQLVKLGGEHLLPPTPLSATLVRCRQTVRTHAYLVRDHARRRLISAIDAATTHWDGAFAQEKSYAPSAFLCTVDGSASDIPDSRPLEPSWP